jgi:hypothetical protein
MHTLNDLSRSRIAFEPASTLIAVIEMSLSSWLVAGCFANCLCRTTWCNDVRWPAWRPSDGAERARWDALDSQGLARSPESLFCTGPNVRRSTGQVLQSLRITIGLMDNAIILRNLLGARSSGLRTMVLISGVRLNLVAISEFSNRLLDRPSVVGHTQFTSTRVRLTGKSLAETELHARVCGKSQSRSARTAGDTTTPTPSLLPHPPVGAKPFILLKDCRPLKGDPHDLHWGPDYYSDGQGGGLWGTKEQKKAQLDNYNFFGWGLKPNP